MQDGSSGVPVGQEAPHALILKLVMGRWVSHAVGVAAELGLPDELGADPRSAEEIAKSAGSDPGATYRLLRALTTLGIGAEDADGGFTATPCSDVLRSDRPDSVRGMARWVNHSIGVRTWAELEYSVRTGKAASKKVFDVENVFDIFAADPAGAAIFNEAMTSFSGQTGAAVVEAYDFEGIETVVDVAGGHGMLLAAILGRHAELKGILFDLPPVVAGAGPLLEAHGVSDRCDVVGGDFFDSVPEGGDAYLLKHIIHDWADDEASRILASCRAVMKPDARLLLVEAVVTPPGVPDMGRIVDLEMLCMAGGKERTEAEYSTLLGAAGFRLQRVIPTHSPVAIVEAVPA